MHRFPKLNCSPIWLVTLVTLLLPACASATPAADSQPAEPSPRAATATSPPEEAAVTPMPFELTSLAFEDEAVIPNRFSCLAEDISPALSWGDPPAGAQSLALLFDDPDAPGGSWVHWIIYNLPAETRGLPEDFQPGAGVPVDGALGANSWGRTEYGGPCPPAGSTHRYVFTLYALDTTLSFETPPGKGDLLAAMDGHILAQTELYGNFSR